MNKKTTYNKSAANKILKAANDPNRTKNGQFKKGNNIFHLHKTEPPTRPKKINQIELQTLAAAYFEYCDNHPIKESVIHQRSGEIIELPKARPYTIEGLCNYIGIAKSVLYNYEQHTETPEEIQRLKTLLYYKHNQPHQPIPPPTDRQETQQEKETREQQNHEQQEQEQKRIRETSAPTYKDLITRIRQICYQNKLEGAIVGIYNANVIIRDLGLADKQEINDTNKTVKIELITTNNREQNREPRTIDITPEPIKLNDTNSAEKSAPPSNEPINKSALPADESPQERNDKSSDKRH